MAIHQDNYSTCLKCLYYYNLPIDSNFQSHDGWPIVLEAERYIKYSIVMLNNKINWKFQTGV